MKLIKFCLLLFCYFSIFMSNAEIQNDFKLQISLLTCDPDDSEPYALFGHAAIRVIDREFGTDQVFNYGIFDFNSPNFIYRFAKGETYYILGDTSTDDFIFSYKIRGSKVIEQVLNLTEEEKNVVCKKLYHNALPENRTYLYNIFYNNCSTKCFDLLEKCIAGVITNTGKGKQQTFRELVRDCTKPQPWTKFGCDLALGKPADKETTVREQTFLPLLLREQLEQAQILTPDGSTRPLIIQTNILEKGNINIDLSAFKKNFFISPFSLFLLLLIIALIITFLEKLNRIKFIPKIFDTVLYLSAGISGCILFFLGFISIHPATNPNYLLLSLHPLWLVFAVKVWIKSKSTLELYIDFITFAAIVGMMIVGLTSIQVFPNEVYLIGLTLMLRNSTQFIKQMSISKRK